jgi:hypothetical protein
VLFGTARKSGSAVCSVLLPAIGRMCPRVSEADIRPAMEAIAASTDGQSFTKTLLVLVDDVSKL